MIHTVMSFFDKAAAAYSRPFFVAAVGQATRIFEDEVNRVSEDNPVCRHPDHFELYKLGVFDDASGRFVNVEPGPEFIVSGSTLKGVR